MCIDWIKKLEMVSGNTFLVRKFFKKSIRISELFVRK